MPTKAANRAALLLPSGPPAATPVEGAAKLLRLAFPADRQLLQLYRTGLFRDGGHGKQRDDGGKVPTIRGMCD
jgi:hypothetical protein